LIAAYDIFVLPSVLPESFPTTVLEAMAAGKPVVASATGGTVEQVEDGVTGFLVQPGSINELADSLTTLIENRQQRTLMGLAGRKRMLKLFTIEEYIRGIEAVYQQLKP
jgi:glycosyltransferase involved in cell wall biosynthesis